MMTAARPFASYDAMEVTAEVIWAWLTPADWLEAFAAHPRIGAGKEDPAREARTAGEAWSQQEQAGARSASSHVLDRLAVRNREYDERFGYIFIVCATGKNADEMLALLERRLDNAPEEELRIAAGEQAKITRLRLLRLISEVDS
jgi:OHCU decarboxylase